MTSPYPPHPPHPAQPADQSDLPIVRLLTAAFVTLVGLFVVGLLLGGSIGSRPSVSVAGGSSIPRAPADRRLFLASLGGFSIDTLQTLAQFYRGKYGLQIKILEPASIDPSARDEGRGQLIAEDLIESMRSSYPEVAADSGAVVIGVVSEDLYIRDRPDWEWAFGLRSLGRFGVVSTARMTLGLGVSDELAMARLRKMVTRDIGRMYYRLPVSADPRSVLFGEIDGLADLDRIGEDF